MKKYIWYLMIATIIAGCNQTKTSFKPFDDNEIIDLTIFDSISLALNNEATQLLNEYKAQNDTSITILLNKSLILIDSALAIDDSFPLLYYNKIQILANLGKRDSALYTFDLAHNKYPNNPYLFLARGILFARKGNLDDALNDFRHSFFLFENTNSSVIQLDIESKEIAFMLGYGKSLAEKRLDSLIKCKHQIFYDRRLKKHILSIELDSLVFNW
jgi:tetratricopeptide (TPR) repeat protein